MLAFSSFAQIPLLALYAVLSVCILLLLIIGRPYRTGLATALHVLRELMASLTVCLISLSTFLYQIDEFHLSNILGVSALGTMVLGILAELGIAGLQGHMVLSRNVRNSLLSVKKQYYLELLVNCRLGRKEIDQMIVEANLNDLCLASLPEVDYPVLSLQFEPARVVLQHTPSIRFNQPHEFFLERNFKAQNVVKYLLREEQADDIRRALAAELDFLQVDAIELLVTIRQSSCRLGQVIKLS